MIKQINQKKRRGFKVRVLEIFPNDNLVLISFLNIFSNKENAQQNENDFELYLLIYFFNYINRFI